MTLQRQKLSFPDHSAEALALAKRLFKFEEFYAVCMRKKQDGHWQTLAVVADKMVIRHPKQLASYMFAAEANVSIENYVQALDNTTRAIALAATKMKTGKTDDHTHKQVRRIMGFRMIAAEALASMFSGQLDKESKERALGYFNIAGKAANAILAVEPDNFDAKRISRAAHRYTGENTPPRNIHP